MEDTNRPDRRQNDDPDRSASEPTDFCVHRHRWGSALLRWQAAAARYVRPAVICCIYLLIHRPLTAFAAPEPPDAAPTVHRILVVYGGGRDEAANQEFDKAFRSTVSGTLAGPVEYYSEYLESNRFDMSEQGPALRDYLRMKYAHESIDVVVAFSTAALDFLVNQGDDVFPDVPIVFHTIGVPPVQSAQLTGISLERPYAKTVGLALTLHPDAKEVLVVTGTSSWDRQRELRARSELAPFASRVTFQYLSGMPLATMMTRIKTAGPETIVFYVRDSRGVDGRELSAEDMLSMIASVASGPVYSVGSATIGHGTVGGYLFDPRRGGASVGDIVVQVLGGRSPSQIPVTTLDMTPTFDYRQLRHWNISEARLPAASVVMFREPATWQRYGPYLAAGLLVLGGEAALIVGLVLQRRRRHAAEQETLRAEDRYRSIVETQSEMICRFLPDTTLTFVNEAYCRFFDSTPERLLGTKFVDLIPETERADVLAAIAAIKKIESHEHAVVLPDGTIGWQHWTNRAIHDRSGQLVELQGMGRDITDRHRTEQALRSMEARNSAFLKALPDLMFVLERDGTYVDFHARDPQLLFVEPSQFLGRTIREVMPPDLADIIMTAIERVWTTDDSVIVEYELPVPEPRHFECRVVRAEGGRLLSIVRDVTESKRALAENRDLVGRLIVSQEVERQRIARELHDDLSQKIALLNIDLDQFAAQANVAEYRSRLQDISVRAGEIASDVHQLSHELHPSKLQTLGLVAAIRSLCRDVSSKGSLDVEFAHPDRELSLEPDASLCLYRITQEALHNVTRHSRARHASVQLVIEPPDVRLYIADSGVGFDATNGSAMGLGLVSMRERVGLLRGQIVIHSRPGEGTRIGVRLPLSSTRGNDAIAMSIAPAGQPVGRSA